MELVDRYDENKFNKKERPGYGMYVLVKLKHDKFGETLKQGRYMMRVPINIKSPELNLILLSLIWDDEEN